MSEQKIPGGVSSPVGQAAFLFIHATVSEDENFLDTGAASFHGSVNK